MQKKCSSISVLDRTRIISECSEFPKYYIGKFANIRELVPPKKYQIFYIKRKLGKYLVNYIFCDF